MPRLAQLPPRIPVRNTSSSTNTVSPRECKDKNDHTVPCQGSLFGDQSPRVDNVLDDYGLSLSKLPPLRRAVSDPVAILEGSSTFDFSAFPTEDGTSFSNDTYSELNESANADDFYSGELESSCVYGPNSPRIVKDLTRSESSMASDILESCTHNSFQYMSVIPNNSDLRECDVNGENCTLTSNSNSDRLSRRHSGQHSRVRKLQYIAELEKTVNAYQALEAELAVEVAALFQQRAALSLENSTLKQRITNLKKEKMIKDGEHQSLKKEIKKLKMGYSGKSKSIRATQFPPDRQDKNPSFINWQLPDMGKLNLGENAYSMRHGFRG